MKRGKEKMRRAQYRSSVRRWLREVERIVAAETGIPASMFALHAPGVR
jgi:hypothetical protein